MQHLHAEYSASITELKRNPMQVIKEADEAAIAILNHNKPAAYLIPPAQYEMLLARIEDYELGQLIEARQGELSKAVSVSIDDL